MAGKLEAFPGEKPDLNDWMNHLGNIYPEVRLKKYLEMRGADCCPKEFLNALPALWVSFAMTTRLPQMWTQNQNSHASENFFILHSITRYCVEFKCENVM